MNNKIPHIPTKPVTSSNIKAIGHDPKTNTLRVEFLSGGIYDYPGVTPQEHADFAAAESHGKHFHRHLRGREFTRIDSLKAA